MKRRYDRVFERSNSYNFRNEPYKSTNNTSVPASFTRFPDERNRLEYSIAEDYRFNKLPRTEAKDDYHDSSYPYNLQQQSSYTSFPETEVFKHIQYEDSYTYSMNYGKLVNYEEDDDHGEDFDSAENQNKTFDSESRSIYVGHLPENVIYYDLGKAANEFGPIELMRLVPRKRCAFLNFLNIADARKMMQKYSGSCVPHPEQEPNTENCLLIQNKPVRLSWSNTRPLSEEVRDAIESLDATRNLFVFYGNCMKPVPGQRLQPMTPDELATKFRLFGHIENIVIKPKKNIAFVNVTSITSAINAYRASEDEPGILLRGEKLVVKFSQENEQKYTSDRNDPRNQILGAGLGMAHLGLSPPLPLEPPLPPGWLESFDEKSGCKYYYHSQRRVTQWEHPITGKTSLSMKSPPSQLDSFVSQNGSTLNSRAVILQNLPETADYQQICTIARPHGVIESVRLHAEKHVAFINYVQPESALSLHTQSLRAPYTMGNNILKVNWAKEVPIRPYLLEAIINEGACRSLYLRDLTEAVTEDDIRDAFTEIASTEIESIMLMPEAKPIGFVNFIDIISAKKVLDYYKQNHEGVLTIKGVQMQISYVNVTKKLNKGVPTEYGGVGVSLTGAVNRNTRAECRSVIVSGFPAETLLSDISKAGNLFGQIESVYLNTEKNHAFINYVHPQSAESFVRRSKDSGLEIRGQKVRVGYGKSVPIRHDIVLAINTEGASRSLYVGGIEGENAEERLKEMLSAMCDGVFDSIAVNAEKKYAFVNLASISAAKKVMDECRGGMVLDGMPLKFSYAKTK